MHGDRDVEVNALIDRIRSYWEENGVKIRPGASLSQIEGFESRHQVRLPHDLRAYFTTIDGMDEAENEPDMFSFLPLKAVKTVPEELAHNGGIPDYRAIVQSLANPHRWFVIVDYLLNSAVFAIRLSTVNEDTPVLLIEDGNSYRIAAPSFSDFLTAYLAEPLRLLE